MVRSNGKANTAGAVRADVRVGELDIAIRRTGNSTATVARVLRLKIAQDGARTVLLDRLVHAEHETSFESSGSIWHVRGCYVSELEEVKLAQHEGAS